MIMRKPLIAGNWKMNTDITEAIDLVRTMLPELERISGVEKVLCPPFISLSAVSELIKSTSIRLGAQNMHFESHGAFTGEISPRMIINVCDFVILGHSERRQYFAEKDEIVNRKVQAALEIGLKPILCIGESLEDNEANRTDEIITRQVQTGLAGINSSSELVVAYEPVWAIGTGKAATGRQANATIASIRNIIASIWGNTVAQAIRILYGGSVIGTNIAEFIVEPEIDGALVGGASLKADDFLSIVRQTATIKAAK